MKVGILGSGDVGQRLATGFARQRGDEVMMGTRDPRKEEVQAWVKQAGAKARAGTFEEAAAFGEVVVLATNWTGTENAVQLARPANLAGKVLIDVTNPLDFSGGMPPKLAVSGHDSGGETVQRWAPDAKVVKCWNTVTHLYMTSPDVGGEKPTLLLCGNDAGAKKQVEDIARSFGWEDVADLGGIDASRYLEAMCIVWVLEMVRRGGKPTHAIKMLRA